MKKMLLFICVALVTILLWLLFRRHETPQAMPVLGADTNQVVKPLSSSNSNLLNEVTNIDGVVVSMEWAKAREERMNKRQALVEKSLNEWRTPIEFYGKVVDENTNLVAGAQIDFECNDLSKEGTSYYHTQSDANGLFSIKGITGKLLGVYVNKIGYYSYDPHGQDFYYAGQNQNFVPDQWNPVVFKLRKKGESADLIQQEFPPGIGQIWQLHRDGTPIKLDLLNGNRTVAGDGQLELEFWRDLSQKNAKTYDWKVQLSIVGGGLVETNEQFAFQAPKNGFSPSLVIDMPATNQDWIGEVRKKFYLQLPDGKYGRIDFYLLPYNGVFTLQSAVNPSGSRNLESDSGR